MPTKTFQNPGERISRRGQPPWEIAYLYPSQIDVKPLFAAAKPHSR